jgi:beta-mannosidase
MRYLSFIFLLLPFLYIAQFAKDIDLSNQFENLWQFRKNGETEWRKAIVPGNIYVDLESHKIIPDPFYGSNEKKVQWVDTCDWEYKGEFNLDETSLQNFKHAEISLNGIDTYSRIFLNDSLIFITNNTFRTWKREVKKFLHTGKNTLYFQFEAAVKKGRTLSRQIPYKLPGEEKVFTRKPQYQYGWDWGPRLVGCGITQKPKLSLWKEIKLNDFHIEQIEINKDSAELTAHVTIQCESKNTCSLQIKTKNETEQVYIDEPVNLIAGLNTLKYKLKIKKPQLWWCNGYGNPHLYTFELCISDKPGCEIYSVQKIGLRKIELVREKDPFGKSFFFRLNGSPIFAKGANFIPPHSFIDNSQAYTYPSLAKQVNMNMLRVWGGGTYADDNFYSECDKNGILVWQDFMFACAMYPGDSAFINNVKAEAKEQVQRLRNHPCVALWCGNNEIDEGWNNWGWQKEFKYSKQDSSQIWDNYSELFQKTLPEIVKKNAPQSNYWPSSPMIGWGHRESLLQGDSHYWGVWWGMEPFGMYEKKVGRFMSEYGFQGMPSLETFKTFCSTNELSLKSATVKDHQKHPAGYQTIQAYLERDYKTPKEFEKYIYVSQLLQRDGMKTAIESHRRYKPYCMGTLFWQFNDCWPVTSWSALDYNNNPKALYYELPKLYNNLLISVHKEREKYKVYIISDTIAEFNGVLIFKLLNFKGETILIKEKILNIAPQSSTVYFSFNENELEKLSKNAIYISCKFTDKNGNIRAASNYFFAKPKGLKLFKPNVKITLSGDRASLIVSTNVFTKDFFLFSDQPGLKFSDNFFDLEPEKPVEIKLNRPLLAKNTIKYFSLFNINNSSN